VLTATPCTYPLRGWMIGNPATTYPFSAHYDFATHIV
jgi:hypothetical protein